MNKYLLPADKDPRNPSFNYKNSQNETIGKKIREAELSKVPFMLILGEKEAENENISVRKHRQGDVGSMSVKAFIDLIENETYVSIF